MSDYNGGPIDEAYLNKRLRNEPLVEITQAKGTSETHHFLSKMMNGQILKLQLIILVKRF